ncbi:ribosomal RNA processing protein 1 homolog B [Glycine max]|uniref:ribosomal RNA processing protein 1 homolog B n=1 Tax=Glycine max TaxID=3847 RepID=UPI0003DE7B05|nr:ribosomal RNA processing protein 1 homolog B [Glycine max]|eukprot:XP_006601411.1 ribosomal RNA processing protein 1 homolog B [Glycine max]
MEEHASHVGRSLVKQLACCKRTTRDKSLRLLLKSWLPSQSQPLSDDDAKKLWKGLFYCMWHSDKPLVQSDLVDRLSSLLLSLHLSVSLQYFSTFLLTMRREWSGIDALRLDKFYLLIRRFVSKFFSLMKTNSWDLQLVHRLINVLDENTLSSLENKSHGNGVNYHIATVFLEELRPFLPLKQEVLEVLLKPFVSAMGKVQDKVLVGKIRSGVFDLLLKTGKSLLEVKKSGDGVEVDSRDEVLLIGTVALVMGFLAAAQDSSDKENVASENGGNLNDESAVLLNETMIANLQRQFEKVAEEAGLDDGVASACDSPQAVSASGRTLSKKRKRTKSLKGKVSQDSAELDGEESAVAKGGEKSKKKVRFSMKNNLVWKPQNPLPPQSLRLPPSATPRGSALKKGLPPGPIREMPLPTKKPKLKRARKSIKGVAPVKRLKKLKSRAA